MYFLRHFGQSRVTHMSNSLSIAFDDIIKPNRYSKFILSKQPFIIYDKIKTMSDVKQY